MSDHDLQKNSAPAKDAPAKKGHESPVGRSRPLPISKVLQLRQKSGITGQDVIAHHQAAARGVESGGGDVPHQGTLQPLFGRFDLSNLKAVVGGAAQDACEDLGAHAYAFGEKLAFSKPPDLRTAAHEATHAVLQRHGVQPSGGVGHAGDPFEVHAEMVADRVVAGQPVEDLLENMIGAGSDQGHAVQALQLDEAEERDADEGLTLPEGVNLQAVGARHRPMVKIRTAWLLRMGVSPNATRVPDPAVVKVVVEALNKKFNYGFTPEQIAYASAGTDQSLALSLDGEKVSEQPAVVQYLVAKGLFHSTGLPKGVDVKAYANKFLPAKKGDSPRALCSVLVKDDIIRSAGLTPGVNAVRSSALSARFVGAIEHAFGMAVRPASKTNFLNAQIQRDWFEPGAPGTWTMNLGHRALTSAFGESKLEAWLTKTGTASAEGEGDLGESGFVADQGVSDQDALWAIAFLEEHLGQSAEGARPPSDQPRVITRTLIDILKKLDQHADREAILGSMSSNQTGETHSVAHSKRILNAIHAHELRASRAAAGMEAARTSDSGQEPILFTPVEGEIVSMSEPLIVDKEVNFWFKTRRLTDAFRISRLTVEWRALDESGKLVDDEMCTYTEDSTGDLFNPTFDKPGNYKIYAYVDHNYYLPSDFTIPVVVRTEEEVTRAAEDKEFGAFRGRQTSGGGHDFEHTFTDELVADSAYTHGFKAEGEINDDFWEHYNDNTPALLSRSRVELRELIERYSGSTSRQEQAIASHAEEVLEQLEALGDEMDVYGSDEKYTLFVVKAVYTSRLPNLRSGPMSVQGVYNSADKSVTLKDYSMFVDREVITASGDAGSFDASLEEAFVDLCKNYPDGHMSMMAEGLDDEGAVTLNYTHFRLKTDSVWKDIKGTVFNPIVDITVNVAGAIMLVFPPTAAVGATLLVTYNLARTIGELTEWADKGTLTFKKGALSIGQLLLDVLPAVGSAKRFTQVGGKALMMINSTQFAGQAWIITEHARTQIAQLKSGVVAELAAVETEIRQIQASRPWDPRLAALKQRREQLKTQFEQAASTVIEPLLLNGALMLGGTMLVTSTLTRALQNRVTNLKAADILVETQTGPPARYNAETGKVEINTTKTVTEADIDAAAAARDADLTLRQAIPDASQRQAIREAAGTDRVQVVTGAPATRVEKVGEGYKVHLKSGGTADDVIVAIRAREGVGADLDALSSSGAFKHKSGQTPRYDAETGQIIGDRRQMTPQRLATLKGERDLAMAQWEARFAQALGVDAVTITREAGPTKANISGNSAVVNIPPGGALKRSLTDVKAAATQRPRPETPEPEALRPETGTPDAPPRGLENAADPALKTYPEPRMTVATFRHESNVIVGQPVANVAEGHAILQRLAAGDLDALKGVGIERLPDDFPPNSLEWGLGQKPNGELVIIRGQRMAVAWNGDLDGIVALAHSHPYIPRQNKLVTPKEHAAEGITFRTLLEQPQAHEANIVHLLPSGQDVVFCANRNITHHEVHTPFRHSGGGKIRNPSGLDDASPTISFTIIEPRMVGHHVDLPQLELYEAKLIVKDSQNNVIHTGEIYATRYSAVRMSSASLKHPFPGEVVQAGRQSATLDGTSGGARARVRRVKTPEGQYTFDPTTSSFKKPDGGIANPREVDALLDRYRPSGQGHWQRPNGETASRAEAELLNLRMASRGIAPEPAGLDAIVSRATQRVDAGHGLSLQYSRAELADIVRRGRALGISDEAIEDLIFIGSRDAKRIDAPTLMAQMDFYVNTVLKRGHPSKFSSREEFEVFGAELRAMMQDAGAPTADLRVQGSSLRKVDAGDVDLVSFVSPEAFARHLAELFQGKARRDGTPIDFASMSPSDMKQLARDIQANPEAFNANARTFAHAMVQGNINSKSSFLKPLKKASKAMAAKYPHLNIEAISIQSTDSLFNLKPSMPIP